MKDEYLDERINNIIGERINGWKCKSIYQINVWMDVNLWSRMNEWMNYELTCYGFH